MNIKQHLIKMVLPIVLLIPGLSNANVVFPALDIQNMGGDAGVFLDSSTFSIDATVFSIVTEGAPIDITDVSFNLSSTAGSYDGTTGIFSGTFIVGGGLLEGSFANLSIFSFSSGEGQFGGDLTYTGGSLQGGLKGGRVEGVFTSNFTDVVAKAGQVVPVPAAAWLFGSGLIGLAGIARRKA